MFHQPVLQKEVIRLLNIGPNNHVIDATIGGGGHALAILEKTLPGGMLIGCDLDAAAITEAASKLKKYKSRIRLFNTSYTEISKIYHEQFNDYPISAFLLDLGLSSFELKDRTRGFSFLEPDAPLDMRFSGQGAKASEILNTFSKNELTKILSEYGQEIYTRQIVTEILHHRQKQKFSLVGDLTAVVLRVYKNKLHSHNKKPWTGGTHPATKTFQALRVAVNREIENLVEVLPAAIEILKPGGRLGVISFHSIEDKKVKEFISRESRDCLCPPALPVCRCQHRAVIKKITTKAVKPSRAELLENPRSRSAQLRVVEKL